MAVLLATLQGLAGASSPEQLRRDVGALLRRQGVDHWAYALNLPLVNERTSQFVIADYPAAWVDRYFEADYLHVDPIVTHCHDFSTPFLWSEGQLRARCAVDPHHAKIRRMFDEAGELGLGAGITVPLHGPGQCWGLMSFAAGRERRSELERRLPTLVLIAHYTHEAARPFARSRELGALPVLTHRERECLHWAAEGKTSWEVGRVLGVSERTVIFHLQNAARKLDVSGRQAAVARAVSLGLISVG